MMMMVMTMMTKKCLAHHMASLVPNEARPNTPGDLQEGNGGSPSVRRRGGRPWCQTP